jgi:hypothetical protein
MSRTFPGIDDFVTPVERWWSHADAAVAAVVSGATFVLPIGLAYIGTELGLPIRASVALFGVCLAGAIVSTWATSSARVKRHFRQRLWPSPAR